MSIFNKWKDRIVNYIDLHINLIKLGLIERTSHLFSFILFFFLLLFLGSTVLLFIGFGISEYFCDLLDSKFAGFFITSVFYILIMLGIIYFRKPISNRFSGIFIRIVTEKDEDDDENEEPTIKGENVNS